MPINISHKPLLIQVSTQPAFLLSFFKGQIEYMKRNGFEVAAITSGDEQASLVEQKYGIKVYRVPMRREISIFNDIASLFNLFKTIKNLHPTIMHFHTAKASFLGLIAAYLAGVPVRIVTLHGLRSTDSSGIKERALEFMEKTLCWLSHKIFLVSGSSLDEIRRKKFPHQDRMKILANGSCNGIDAAEIFNPAKYPGTVRAQMRLKYGIPEDAIVLCYVGRIVRDKGIIELTQAWSKLRD